MHKGPGFFAPESPRGSRSRGGCEPEGSPETRVQPETLRPGANHRESGSRGVSTTKTEGRKLRGPCSPWRLLLRPSPVSPAQHCLATSIEPSNRLPRPLATACLIRSPGLCQKKGKGLVDVGQRWMDVLLTCLQPLSSQATGPSIALSLQRRKLKGSPSPENRACSF